jgi:hypothetical protein
MKLYFQHLRLTTALAVLSADASQLKIGGMTIPYTTGHDGRLGCLEACAAAFRQQKTNIHEKILIEYNYLQSVSLYFESGVRR